MPLIAACLAKARRDWVGRRDIPRRMAAESISATLLAPAAVWQVNHRAPPRPLGPQTYDRASGPTLSSSPSIRVPAAGRVESWRRDDSDW